MAVGRISTVQSAGRMGPAPVAGKINAAHVIGAIGGLALLAGPLMLGIRGLRGLKKTKRSKWIRRWLAGNGQTRLWRRARPGKELEKFKWKVWGMMGIRNLKIKLTRV